MSTKALVGIAAVVVLLLVAPLVLKSESAEEEVLPDIPYTGTPVLVKLSPENGATDVPADFSKLKMSFNIEMGGGMSITGQAPKLEGKPKWQKNKRTLIANVTLEPGTHYRFGLNSPSFKNFKDKNGKPLVPVVWEFTTLNADGSEVVSAGPLRVVSLSPANGATGVSSATKTMTIVFNQPMQAGYSLTGQTPDINSKPRWSADKKTLTMSVNLLSNHSYRFGINSPSFRNFRSVQQEELTPMIWQFSTAQ